MIKILVVSTLDITGSHIQLWTIQNSFNIENLVVSIDHEACSLETTWFRLSYRSRSMNTSSVDISSLRDFSLSIYHRSHAPLHLKDSSLSIESFQEADSLVIWYFVSLQLLHNIWPSSWGRGLSQSDPLLQEHIARGRGREGGLLLNLRPVVIQIVFFSTREIKPMSGVLPDWRYCYSYLNRFQSMRPPGYCNQIVVKWCQCRPTIKVQGLASKEHQSEQAMIT